MSTENANEYGGFEYTYDEFYEEKKPPKPPRKFFSYLFKSGRHRHEPDEREVECAFSSANDDDETFDDVKEIGNQTNQHETIGNSDSKDFGFNNVQDSESVPGSIASNATGTSGNEKPKTKRRGRKLLKLVSSVFPKIEPLPWPTFFCLSLWCTVP